ncbi:MAG: DedA family protein, partial [Thermoplasmata archaeon]
MASIFSLTGWAFSFVLAVLGAIGLPGLLALMAVESFGIPPLPSEVILPFSGVLIAEGAAGFAWWTVVPTALAGGLLGAWAAYEVGRSGGRAVLRRWGRRAGVGEKDIARAERYFERRGESTVLLARMVPLVRAYISYPAGAARMDRPRFLAFTFVGMVPFVVLLVYLGTLLGQRYLELQGYFGDLDLVVIAAIVGLAVLWWGLRRRSRPPPAAPGPADSGPGAAARSPG